MSKQFIKTSVMHQDIGEHEHEVIIFDSYEVYAICKKCGTHDWSGDGKGDFSLEAYKKKYPMAKVVDVIEEIKKHG